jgi:hypothetical protein
MKKSTKRLLGVLLALTVLFGLLAVFAVADSIDPDDYAAYGSECGKAPGFYHVKSNGNMIVLKTNKCLDKEKLQPNEKYYTLYSCSACNKGVYEYYPNQQPDHTPVDVPKVEPTCTAKGKTAGTSCAVCGIVLSGQEEIKEKGHPDVNKDGYCDDCKAELRYHCPLCGDAHEGTFGGVIKFFHNIAYYLKGFFGF